VPPLRDRKEDIPLLAQHFLEIFTAKNKKSIKGFTPQSLEKITQYKWPGNVRELMNAVERAVVLSRSEYIDADELIPLMTDGSTAGSERSDSPNNMSLDEVEKGVFWKQSMPAAAIKAKLPAAWALRARLSGKNWINMKNWIT